MLGVAPIVGRAFVDEENEMGRDRAALLSHRLWRQRYGGDRSIVGRAITLSGVPHVVVGVMGPDFQYPSRETQLWTPLTIDPDELTRKAPGNNYLAVARLKPGVSVAQARGEMEAITRRLAEEFGATPGGGRLAGGSAGSGDKDGIAVVPLLEDTTGAVRRPLYMLLGAVSCLLFVACLNLANLLAARAASRAHEFSVRLSLGASRGRLVLQALAEVVPIMVLGGVLGVAFARTGVAAFTPLAPSVLPRVESIALDAPVLLFSVGVLVVTALGAGLLPAMQAWRSGSLETTREGGRSLAGGRHHTRTRTILVVSQIALVLPLLVGAGLLTRSFAALLRVDPGFRTANIQTLQLAIPRSRYRDDADVALFCTRLVERVGGVPGVKSLGMVNRLPLADVGQVNLLEFETSAPIKPLVSADTRTITPDYFQTMGIPLVDGRLFTNYDDGTVPNTRLGPMPSTAIIDERIARSIWPTQRALGKRFRFALDGASWIEIVGVVGHIHHDGLDIDPRPQVYFSHLQRAQDRMALVIHADGDVRGLRPQILQAIREVDPEQPVYDVRMLDDVLDQSIAERRLNTILVATFAVIALMLASIGVYGVMAYGVSRQLREFGIRLALGGRRADITRLVLRRGAVLASTGVVIGLMCAVALARTMQSLLFGVQPGDVTSFAAAAALMVVVALLASYVPARRAASVDPAITLHAE